MQINTTFSYKLRLAVVGVLVSLSLLCSGIPVARAEAPVDIVVDGLTQAQRAELIDNFFISKGNLPLAGHGMVFVKAADAFGIDWRLVPSIGFIESTGGKFACGSNAFGWGGCDRKAFDSFDDAIMTVTEHLAGHNEKTDQYYKGKTLTQIVDTYNPPWVRHDYKRLIFGTMKKIHNPTVIARS